jgi:acetyl-CoA C-acetyltransferase
MLASLSPSFAGLPTARHEAACASGSVALLAASADIEAGRYDLALVVGVEQMRNVAGDQAAAHLGAAAWAGREGQHARFLWPALFDRVLEDYDRRHGVKQEHLAAIAKLNFDNAKRNPNAQTRRWSFDDRSFAVDDEHNPVIEGRLRKQDCGQITDGAAAVVLASEAFASSYASQLGVKLGDVPRIQGWGHRTAPLMLEDKLARDDPHPYRELRGALQDAWRRAGIDSARDVDLMEVHDCFTITEYVILDHLGLHEPGQAHRLVTEGTIARDGALPVNPSGGLIGGGHPVGATGVLLDAYKQLTARAGDYQVREPRRAQTLNIGGSATTTVSFVVGLD